MLPWGTITQSHPPTITQLHHHTITCPQVLHSLRGIAEGMVDTVTRALKSFSEMQTVIVCGPNVDKVRVSYYSTHSSNI